MNGWNEKTMRRARELLPTCEWRDDAGRRIGLFWWGEWKRQTDMPTCDEHGNEDGIDPSYDNCDEEDAAQHIEFACRTELKRRGGGEYRESHSTLSPSSYTCVCIFCGQNFYGETLADCMIAAMENTT